MERHAESLDTEEVSDRILTVPNAISFARLCLVPVFIWLLMDGRDIEALAVFAVAACTDFIDGMVARGTHQVSKLGKLLDPAVDTILMITGVISVVAIGRLPVWICVVIFAREVLLLTGGTILIKLHDIRIPVVYPGKVATTLLFLGFAGLLLNAPVIPGLGICDISWLPGFNADTCAIWVWVVYAGLILQIGVTIHYCISAWHELSSLGRKGR